MASFPRICEGEKEAFVDSFKLSQISKETGFKEGTWGVNGKIERSRVSLELALVVQEGVLRAVPIKSTKKPLMIIIPGNMDKETAAETFSKELGKFTSTLGRVSRIARRCNGRVELSFPTARRGR